MHEALVVELLEKKKVKKSDEGLGAAPGKINCEEFVADITTLFEESTRHSALNLEKKCNFKSTKNTLFAYSKMAKNQFLHQKKV